MDANAGDLSEALSETLSVSQRTIERDLIIEAMTDIAQIQGLRV